MTTETRTPLTDERLAEIRRRHNAATPGPWGFYMDGGETQLDIAADLEETGCGYRARREIAHLEDEPLDNDPTHRDWTDEDDWAQVQADADFIAHARDDVPMLLAELAAVRAERDHQADRAEKLGRQLSAVSDAWRSARSRAAGHWQAAGWIRDERDEAQQKFVAMQGVSKQLLAKNRDACAERDQARTELAKYLVHEPTVAEEMAYLKRCINMVLAVCALAEKQATRWEQPLPVPEWVAAVRKAANGDQPEAGESR